MLWKRYLVLDTWHTILWSTLECHLQGALVCLDGLQVDNENAYFCESSSLVFLSHKRRKTENIRVFLSHRRRKKENIQVFLSLKRRKNENARVFLSHKHRIDSILYNYILHAFPNWLQNEILIFAFDIIEPFFVNGVLVSHFLYLHGLCCIYLWMTFSSHMRDQHIIRFDTMSRLCL